MSTDERFDHRLFRGWLADVVHSVNSKKSENATEPDPPCSIRYVIRIDMPRFVPADRLHRRLGRIKYALSSDPMNECSRFDLFQTGATSDALAGQHHKCVQLWPSPAGQIGRRRRRRYFCRLNMVRVIVSANCGQGNPKIFPIAALLFRQHDRLRKAKYVDRRYFTPTAIARITEQPNRRKST